MVGDTFVVVAPDGRSPLVDRAADLIDRALPPLFDGRLTERPAERVTVLFFSTHPTYAA